MTNAFTRYIALGDSISIDLYPAEDVRLRRAGEAASDEVGAASLFFRNDDRLWPEFSGRDLRTLFPGLSFDRAEDDRTRDAATTVSLLEQVERVRASDEPTIITVTAGGNDLLGEIGIREMTSEDEDPVPSIADRMRRAVVRLLELRPRSLLLVGTVYDPTDGTNRLPGLDRRLEQEAAWLREFNACVADLVRFDSRLQLADIHRRFLGHGLSARPRDRWYLEESVIEPNARGASEVRRVWLEAIGG